MKKRSDGSYKIQKSVIKHLLERINKNIEDITKQDIKNYFIEYLDQKEIKKDTKNTYRSYLRSFFDYVEEILDSKNINFTNPVPNKKKYKFTTRPIDIRKQSEKDTKLLTIPQLDEILDYCKKRFERKVFVFFGLCICTGARFGEILSIKIEDINLEERYFETGLEKNARKSTCRTNETLLFFYPENFKIYLENYILSLKKKGDIWLFPSSRTEEHLSNGPIEYYYRKIRSALGFKFSMHYFRHSIIKHLKRNGCIRENREMLLNHISNSTEGRHYEDEKIEERRKIYDTYFPYYKIPYF